MFSVKFVIPIIILFVFLSGFCSLVQVKAQQTDTFSSVFSGSLRPSGLNEEDLIVYFISSVKSVVFFTFDASKTLPDNTQIESATLRVKVFYPFDANWLSAYVWLESWEDITWDDYTLKKEAMGETNLIGSEWVDQMDTWYSYTFSTLDSTINAIPLMPITVDLESSLYGTNLPQTAIQIEEAQLVVTYSVPTPSPSPTPTATPTPTPTNTPTPTPASTPEPGNSFLSMEALIGIVGALAIVVIVLLVVIFLIIRRNKK